MKKLRAIFKFAFDVRKGEGLRTFFMSLYMLFILWAYYILKPISTAMFVDSFDIDKLPYLYMLIAVAGGLLGFYYTKLADSVLIFHAFAKKSQKTPPQEIALAQKSLKEMIDEES